MKCNVTGLNENKTAYLYFISMYYNVCDVEERAKQKKQNVLVFL